VLNEHGRSEALQALLEREIGTIEQLDTWTARVLSAATLAELLAD
jgi:hypothetical protein